MAAVVIDLVVDGIFSKVFKRHDARFPVARRLGRHLDIPYGIEGEILRWHHLKIIGIERSLSVLLRVPTHKFIIHTLFGVRCEIEVWHVVSVIGLEHLDGL